MNVAFSEFSAEFNQLIQQKIGGPQNIVAFGVTPDNIIGKIGGRKVNDIKVCSSVVRIPGV